MLSALKAHWPEYLMEAGGLGIFMLSAAIFATLLFYPHSPVCQAISSSLVRLVLMGIAMGGTAVGIIYSPWGKQSGAHINPAVTLAFLRLGKIKPWDAFFYIVAQFIGGTAGMFIAVLCLDGPLAASAVNFVVTVPGSAGVAVAFGAEFLISFILFYVILVSSNHERLAQFTGIFAGFLIALYIVVESPLSGMSMNPARTVASALPAHLWTALWLYFIAPILGMQAACEAYVFWVKEEGPICAKLHHQNEKRCIFECGYSKQAEAASHGLTEGTGLDRSAS
jgi:aquaporin Z